MAAPPRSLTTWAATAMVVSEVVGVGIFLSPATMLRTLGRFEVVLGVWLGMGVLSAAGALVYAELATRFPRAGGGYVFLREAYGRRCAFVYGWMTLLVIDPGIAAALGIGLSQYLLAFAGASTALIVPVALAAIGVIGGVTLIGLQAAAVVMRWTAAAKLALVAVLVVAGVIGAHRADAAGDGVEAGLSLPLLAQAVVAAFFAFGGWWELGRMSGDVAAPRRTLPRALVGGVAIVTAIYALVSVTFLLVAPPGASASDEALVARVGSALFGDASARLLAAMVVVAVAGSLAAVLMRSPRAYVAMATDGLFPARLARVDPERGTVPAATLVQMALAGLLVLLGTFDQILGFFVPAAVFFLGLSAAAVLVLPRPVGDATVFHAPAHPLPIALFLLLVVTVLALMLVGQPRQTLLAAVVVALGVPASYLFLPTKATG